MKKLLFILLLCNIKQIDAQTWVTIPDSYFVNYLHVIVPSAMQGDSLNTSSTIVTTYTQTINVYNFGILNLTGIQYFTSIDTLICSSNGITLIPALPPFLKYIDCSANDLDSLPVLANSLTYLNCSDNYLTSLPSLPNTLYHLDCSSNSQLPSLPVLPNTLTYLNCNSNSHISSLPALPNALTYLDCADNALTSLPTLPNSITYLDCSYNHINSIPTLPSSLIYFGCDNNSLVSLPAIPNSLIYLYCPSNSLTSIPPLPNTLKVLYCDYNDLTTLPTLPSTLTYLSCEYNHISCFPIFPNSITTFLIDPNLYNCLPNYIAAMGTPTYPLCTVGNTHGCTVYTTDMEQLISGSDGVNINISPNPNNGSFQVAYTGNSGQASINMYDVTGKMVLSQTINGKTTIDANTLNEGVYNISLISNEGVVNKRLVIVR